MPSKKLINSITGFSLDIEHTQILQIIRDLREGNTSSFDDLLTRGLDINASDTYGLTFLDFLLNADAPDTKTYSAITRLVSLGASGQVVSSVIGSSLLSKSIKLNNLALLEALIPHDRKIILSEPELVALYNTISQFPDNNILEYFISRNGNFLNEITHDGSIIGTHLLSKAIYGHHSNISAIITTLVNSGVSPNTKFAGGSALMEACAIRNIEAAKILIDLGADVNYVFTIEIAAGHKELLQQYAPIHICMLHQNIEMVRYLIEHGADVNCTVLMNGSPLQLAIGHKNIEMVRYLIENGAEITPKTLQTARTPELMNIEIMQYLLEKSIDIALSKVQIGGYREVQELVKEAVEAGIDGRETYTLVKAINKYEIKYKICYKNNLAALEEERTKLAIHQDADSLKNIMKKFSSLIAILRELDADCIRSSELLLISKIDEHESTRATLAQGISDVIMKFDDIIKSINQFYSKKNKAGLKSEKALDDELKNIEKLHKALSTAADEGITIDTRAFYKKILTLNGVLSKHGRHAIEVFESEPAQVFTCDVLDGPVTFNGLYDTANLRFYAILHKNNPHHVFCQAVKEGITYAIPSENVKSKAAKKLTTTLKNFYQDDNRQEIATIKYAQHCGISGHFITKYIENSVEPIYKELVEKISSTTDKSTVGARSCTTSEYVSGYSDAADDIACMEDVDGYVLEAITEEDSEEDGRQISTMSSQNIKFLFDILSTNWAEKREDTGVTLAHITRLIQALDHPYLTIHGHVVKNLSTGDTIGTHASHGWHGHNLDFHYLNALKGLLITSDIFTIYQDAFIEHRLLISVDEALAPSSRCVPCEDTLVTAPKDCVVVVEVSDDYCDTLPCEYVLDELGLGGENSFPNEKPGD